MEVVSLDKIVSRVQMTDKDYSQTCLPNTVQGQYPPIKEIPGTPKGRVR